MTSIRHNSESEDPSPFPVRMAGDSGDDGYLDAAREAILAVGWSRTTLTDIARRAGVSRMTLYRRWPDMQTMLSDLMTREWTRAVEDAAGLSLPTGPADASGTDDTLARIARGMVATVRALRANDLLRRIIELDPELLLPYLLERRGRSQQQVATMLAHLLAEGQREGSVRAGDPDLLARSLLLAAHGFTLSAHTMVEADQRPAPRDADVSAFDDELTQLVERYLRP